MASRDPQTKQKQTRAEPPGLALEATGLQNTSATCTMYIVHSVPEDRDGGGDWGASPAIRQKLYITDNGCWLAAVVMAGQQRHKTHLTAQ